MIALDAMGGDFAPDQVIQGALHAAKEGIPLKLFGPKQRIEKLLSTFDACWESYGIEVVDAPEEIAMGEEPVNAVRKKQQSSLVKAVASVAQGYCTAVVSAGNSGALMAAATFILGRQDGIERPAIAGFLPGYKRQVVVLDLGANADCKPHHLLQFAHLGITYAQDMLGIQKPSVALLCNGAEKGKGSLLVKEAYCLLEESGVPFFGNIEPGDIVQNKVDVVVCDGFSGNIMLKTVEAMLDLVSTKVFEEHINQLSQIPHAERAKAEEILTSLQKSIKEKGREKAQGGAMLLGVKGIVIVAHGCAQSTDIKNAVTFAYQMSKNKGEGNGK